MVKRYEFDPYGCRMANDDSDGFYVLHSDYAALAESHARLLEALKAAMAFIDSHAADPDITFEMVEKYAALQDSKPLEAIAAAQPFAEK